MPSNRIGALLLLLACAAGASHVPFILIPGLTVPTLEAKFDVKSAPHFYCPKHSKDYEPVYLVTDDLLPGIRDCYTALMLMEEHDGHFTNASGVDIRVPGFGLLSSMLYFNIAGKKLPIYLDFANNMTAAGWVLDVTARGAPYDWRYDPATLMDTGYADQLQALVESMYTQLNSSKIALIGHSYGCNVAHTFLRRMSASWKAQYIAGFLSLSGPFAGSFNAVLAILSGSFEQSHGIGFSAAQLAALSRNVTSTNYLIPASKLYAADDVLVRLGDANYTHSQLDLLLQTHGLAAVAEWRSLIANVSADLNAPDVPTLCMRGSNISTAFSIRYLDGTFNNAPANVQISSRDGDGIVPTSSLQVCAGWASQQTQPVSDAPIPNMPHGSELFIQEIIDYIIKLLSPSSGELEFNPI